MSGFALELVSCFVITEQARRNRPRSYFQKSDSSVLGPERRSFWCTDVAKAKRFDTAAAALFEIRLDRMLFGCAVVRQVVDGVVRKRRRKA